MVTKTSLSIRHAGLSTLPRSLRQRTGLKQLDVTGNELDGLPPWLTELTELESLYLDGNALRELPSWIGDFHALRELHVDRNPLEALPSTLGRSVTWSDSACARHDSRGSGRDRPARQLAGPAAAGQ